MIYAGTVVTIKHYKPIGSRTIAIGTDLEHVRRLIEGNYGDVNDGNTYELAVIEELEEKVGVYPIPLKSHWYKFVPGKKEHDCGNYVPIAKEDTPETLHHTTCFYG